MLGVLASMKVVGVEQQAPVLSTPSRPSRLCALSHLVAYRPSITVTSLYIAGPQHVFIVYLIVR